MEGNRLVTGLIKACNWICYFFYLNVMWIACTLLGLVIAGLIPSTVALYSTARRTLLGDENVPVFHTFWKKYKEEWMSSNLFGLIFFGIGIVWFVDIIIVRQFEGLLAEIFYYSLIIIGMLYFITCCYIFPVYVHYDMKRIEYIKNALALGFLYPFHTIAMALTIGLTCYFLLMFQGFIPLFAFSLLAHINIGFAFQVFRRIFEKGKRYHRSELLESG